MKYYISDIIPRIQQFSKRLDEDTLLINHDWVAFNDTLTAKMNYIFRKNGELIISEKGIGKKAKWENLGNQRLLIEQDDTILHFRNSFFDETILVLNLNDTNTYAFFLNETKIGVNFQSIIQINHYLDKKYNLAGGETASKKTFADFTTLSYLEGAPEKLWNLALGDYTRIKISFSNGITDEIYRGSNTGKYFYAHWLKGLVYCGDKPDCIYQLYLHKTNQI